MSQIDSAEHQRLLNCLMRVTRDRDLAEDLLQSAFVRLTEYKQSGQVENEAGFLIRTATNIAIDQARRTRTRAEVLWPELMMRNVRDTQPLQDEVLLARERLAQLNLAFGQLSARTREIFLMHRIGKRKYRDIALTFGVSQSLVEKEIAKAALFLANWVDAAQTSDAVAPLSDRAGEKAEAGAGSRRRKVGAGPA